jgi:hypothetical protein
MTGQQAVRLIDQLLDLAQQRKLNDLESTIILGTWEGGTYRAIADRLSYAPDYIKQIAAKLWKLLTQLLSENICKSNIKSVLERCQRSTQLSRGENQDNNKIDLQAAKTWMISDKLAVFSSLENHQSFKSRLTSTK